MDEYCRMFGLLPRDLHRKILGCADGPASFNCEMTAGGHSVTSVDPIYRFSASQIEQRVRETYRLVIDPLYDNLQDYVWQRFKNPRELGKERLAIMGRFLEDYESGRRAGRYQDQSVPNLSFDENSFDLALCSHFLFLYSEQLSYDFHLNAIVELCRVASELRIFPLLDLSCHTSPYVDDLSTDLPELGYQIEIQAVPYEFQRGGNRMMRVTKL